MDFADRVDRILEDGHWDKYDPKKPAHFIIDKKSWPKIKKPGDKIKFGPKRIAGKL